MKHTTTYLNVLILAAAIGNTVGQVAVAGQDDRLLRAISRVESGNNSQAVGDHGLARGAYQIHPDAWLQGCREIGVKWSYRTGVYDDAKCRAVIRGLWKFYRVTSDRDKSLSFHWGPSWRRHNATYWLLVRRAMR